MDSPLNTAQPNPRFRLAFLAALVVMAAASRLLPHPPNFAPIGAMALFGGAAAGSPVAAFVIPFVALLLSDLVIGFHATVPAVYICFAVYVLIGLWLRSQWRKQPVINVSLVAGGALTGAVIFFVVTNFAVWWVYSPSTAPPVSRDFAGLLYTYEIALPFFRNTLLGDAVYCTILFGALALAEAKFPALKTQQRMQPASA